MLEYSSRLSIKTQKSHLTVLQLIPTFGSISSRWFCMNIVEAYQSEKLNSYGMFQPSGPNFLRSCTTVWRNETAQSIGRYCGAPLQSSMSWLIPLYVRIKPALIPVQQHNEIQLLHFLFIQMKLRANVNNTFCQSCILKQKKMFSSSLFMNIHTKILINEKRNIIFDQGTFYQIGGSIFILSYITLRNLLNIFM